MNDRNKKLVRRIQYPAYIQFFIGILFWICAGLGFFEGLSISVYVLMLMLLVCNISIILFSFLLDKFYLNNLKESFENLENLNLKLRSQRHEYLNEMQIVYGLLELGEYNEAYNYLKPVYEDIAKVGKALRTTKPAVNALLQAKIEYSQKHEVALYVEVSSDLGQLSVEQWDLCRVLGNLIDNACTAVLQNDGEKSIHVVINEDKKWYHFCVYNNGPLIPEVHKYAPHAVYVPRTGQINTWDNPLFVDAVKKTKRKTLIIAGTLTSVCIAFPAVSAVKDDLTQQ